MTGKIQQLDLFINEQKQREILEEEEHKRVVAKSMRCLFSRVNEVEFVCMEMEKKLDQLMEVLLKYVHSP